jgi:hypothetical protein
MHKSYYIPTIDNFNIAKTFLDSASKPNLVDTAQWQAA